jgi:hypothetical protein
MNGTSAYQPLHDLDGEHLKARAIKQYTNLTLVTKLASLRKFQWVVSPASTYFVMIVMP